MHAQLGLGIYGRQLLTRDAAWPERAFNTLVGN